jgi:hypothetical protein
MSLRRAVPALVAAVVLCIAPSAVAHPHEVHRDGATAAPLGKIRGLSAEQIAERSIARLYEEPGFDATGCVPLAPGVVELIVPPEGGDVPCALAPGETLVWVAVATCSTAEPPPFYAPDEAGQRACARAALEGTPSIPVSVDGGPSVDLTSETFAFETRQFTVNVAPGNVVDARPGPATVVGVGAAMEFDLHPGRHTIAITPTGENAPPPATVTVDVGSSCKPPRS